MRVYANESKSKAILEDMATITGSTPYANFTMYQKIYRDDADTTTTTTNWGLATSGDGAAYTSAANWATTFSSTRYLKVSFDPNVPSGSVITSACLDPTTTSQTLPDTACWYFETYNGATLLGTHGSSGTPVSCNATSSFSADHVTLAELTGVTDANNLTVKIYMKDSVSKKSQTDFAQLNVNYYLD